MSQDRTGNVEKVALSAGEAASRVLEQAADALKRGVKPLSSYIDRVAAQLAHVKVAAPGWAVERPEEHS